MSSINLRDLKDALRPTSDRNMARNVGEFYAKYRPQIHELLNAAGDNAVAVGLKRNALIQEGAFAFSARLLALRVFSTCFDAVRLEGTNKATVPYYPLETVASTDWNPANGYEIGETVTEEREIEINRRKYQSFSLKSAEVARQPFLMSVNLIRTKSEALAADVFQDILSVVTAANYGEAALTTQPSAFDFDDVGDLRTACNRWRGPRGLVLSASFDGALVKSLGSAAVYGSTDPVREGKAPRVCGFDIYGGVELPTNGEGLAGFAAHPAAMLVAFAPIQPVPEVLAKIKYELYSDPTTGATLEYRSYGDAQMDTSVHTIEANYGFAKCNTDALKRIVIAS